MDKLDYLPLHENIKLKQRKDMFRLNTDTSLLGEFFSFFDGETLLDIGTNNGALLLYTKLKANGKLIGVDIFPEALELAKFNLQLNGLEATLLLKNAKELNLKEKVDVIISNPPFFKKECATKSTSIYLLKARHETDLTLEELFLCVKRNIKSNGRFYLIHRFDRKEEILSLARKYNFLLVDNKDNFDIRVNKYVSSLFYFKVSF